MTPREVIRRLEREGWLRREGKGGHLHFVRDGRRVTVANHRGDIAKGTLRSICKQAGWQYPPER